MMVSRFVPKCSMYMVSLPKLVDMNTQGFPKCITHDEIYNLGMFNIGRWKEPIQIIGKYNFGCHPAI